MHDVVEQGLLQPGNAAKIVSAAAGDENEAGFAEDQMVVFDLEIQGGPQLLRVLWVASHKHMELVGFVDQQALGRKVGGDPLHAAEKAAGNQLCVHADGGTKGLLRRAGEEGLRAAAAPGKIRFIHGLILLCVMKVHQLPK